MEARTRPLGASSRSDACRRSDSGLTFEVSRAAQARRLERFVGRACPQPIGVL